MRSTGMVQGFLGIVVLAACLSGMARGNEDYRQGALEEGNVTNSETADLRSEVSEARSQLTTSAGGSYEAGCGCDGCCGCCQSCCDCCCQPGFVGGAEVGWLKPHNSGGTGFTTNLLNANAGVLGIGVGTVLNFTVDPDFETTSRFWVGWDRGDGVGVRVRYWEFDHAFSAPATLPAGTVIGGALLGIAFPGRALHNWDTYTLDVEGFATERLGCWDATWSFGVRYVEYEEVRGIDTFAAGLPIIVNFSKDFSGIGITGGLELRRQLTDRLGVFTNARASVLMDDENEQFFSNAANIVILTFAAEQRNDVKAIFETQLGVEWTRPTYGGGYFFARAGAEMQYWNNFGLSAASLVSDETAGFGGFFASVGINR